MATDITVEQLERQLEEVKKGSKIKQLKKRLISIAVVVALIFGAFGVAWLSGNSHAKEKYIEKIESLLPYADVEILDFVCQFLQKSVDTTLQVDPLIEHSQLA